jgi:ribonucleoside-triphosphate reductase
MNFLGKGIETPEGKEFMEDVLYFMRSKIEGYTRTTGILFNLEATPSEGTSFRLAQIDKATFPEIYTSGEDVAYYTNSCHPPVGWTDDIFKALDHQDSLQTIMTGGTVVHIFTGEKLEARGVAALVKKVVDNYKLPYFSITPTFSLCPDHKYFAGEHDKCPTCGKDCSIYSRIVGYMRAVKDWNRGKREEFKDRKPYKI